MEEGFLDEVSQIPVSWAKGEDPQGKIWPVPFYREMYRKMRDGINDSVFGQLIERPNYEREKMKIRSFKPNDLVCSQTAYHSPIKQSQGHFQLHNRLENYSSSAVVFFGSDGCLTSYNWVTGSVSRLQKPIEAYEFPLSLSVKEEFAAVSCDDGTVKLVDLAQKKEIYKIQVTEREDLTHAKNILIFFH